MRTPSSGSPILRHPLDWIGATCLRWFYREQRLVGAERVPARGAVLLIGNHPNDLPDVLLGYRVSPRPLRYLATVSAATNWASRKTYEWLGVIPIVRVRDARKMRAAGLDIVALNRAATDAVASAFAAGQLLGAFPEGGVRDLPALDRFRTGVASMVLKYVETGANNDVHIVPFGVQYEAPRTVGSDVITVVGEGFSVRDWLSAQPASEVGAAALTARMFEALRGVTRNSPTWEAAAHRDRLLAALAALAAAAEPSGDPLTAAAALAPTAEALIGQMDTDLVRYQTIAGDLASAVARADGIPTSARDHALLLGALGGEGGGALASVAGLVVRLPLALLGWLTHGPIFAAARALARRRATVRTDEVAFTFVPGLYLVALWYLLLALGAAGLLGAAGRSPLWVFPILLLLPRLGDVAVGWRHRLRAWRVARRVRRWPAHDRAALRTAAAELAGALDRGRSGFGAD